MTEFLHDDHILAADLARTAGETLLELRHSDSLRGQELKDAGDRLANRVLLEGLAAARPHDAVLTEESPDDGSRLDHERVWIVDPLDGTREFAEPGRDDWAVHVALAVGGIPVVGAVALPARDEVLSTSVELSVPQTSRTELEIVVSRSRAPQFLSDVAHRMGGILVPMGSAGAKAMAVVRGEADAYIHAGGQYEWDSCAPAAVARSAGLHASRLDGSPLLYNREDPYLPDLLICDPTLADALLAAVAQLWTRT